MEIGLVATEMQATSALCLAWDLYPALPSRWPGLVPVACIPENSFHMDHTPAGQHPSAAAFSHSKKGAQEITFLSHQASQCSSKDNTSKSWGWLLPAVSGLEQEWSQRHFITGQWMKKAMGCMQIFCLFRWSLQQRTSHMHRVWLLCFWHLKSPFDFFTENENQLSECDVRISEIPVLQ